MAKRKLRIQSQSLDEAIEDPDVKQLNAETMEQVMKSFVGSRIIELFFEFDELTIITDQAGCDPGWLRHFTIKVNVIATGDAEPRTVQ